METHKGNTPVPAHNTVVMEEADEALLDAAITVVEAKKAEKAANAVKTLREQFSVEMFIEEKKAIGDRIKRGEHKLVFGTEECNERCGKSFYACPGVTPWSVHKYGGQQQFDALYESWFRKNTGVA
jgi:hypothetical protein